MKRLAPKLALLLLASCAGTQPAYAQSYEVRRVLSDYGWHGVGGNVQVHQPTLDAALPWVSTWQRSAIGNQYGQWLYMQVLYDCENWTHTPFATIDQDDRFVLLADLGIESQARWADPGTEPYRTMTAVCALYGYRRRDVNFDTPTAEIGEIRR